MSGLEQLYQQVILDHSKQRIGDSELAGRSTGEPVGSSHQVNPTCGDEITVEVCRASDHPGYEVRWSGEGCSISMASASVMTELAQELDTSEFAQVEAEFHELMHSRGKLEPDEAVLGDAAAFAGVSKFPARIKCALLAWMAAKDAIHQIEGA